MSHDHTATPLYGTGYIQRTRLPRRLWRFLFRLPLIRLLFYRPHGTKHSEFQYRCYDCNQWSHGEEGYSYYQGKNHEELCWQCWLMRRAKHVNAKDHTK